MNSLAQADPIFVARDRYLASCLLSPFADDMARRLSRLNTGPLLEIAADTGALTRAAASAVSAGIAIVATDSNPLSVATLRRNSGLARVTWRVADPCDLPFQDSTFGIVACQFAMAWQPDRASALSEARRVMRPGGRFVFSVPGLPRFNPVARCVQTALEGMFPDDPSAFISRGLHGDNDDGAIDNDLTDAGFTDAVYTNVDLRFAARAEEAAISYCLGTGLRGEIECRCSADTAVDTVAESLRRQFGSDVIRAPMRALLVSASA